MVAPILVTLLILALITILVLAVINQKKKERARTQSLQKMAEQLGWSFEPAVPLDGLPGIEGFALFEQGLNRQIKNVMYNERDEVNITVFDYIYSVGRGKRVTTYFQSVVHFEPAGQSFPEFTLRPEGAFDKMLSTFGYQDIDFGQRPEFSRQYILRGKDEAAIRQTFTDRLLAFYESLPGTFTDAADNRLFMYRPEHRLQPEEIESEVERGRQLLGLMGQY
jgi:hypothetical protein